ncbi:hypothetical protein B0H16DRAFT_1726519 [Mycena metata]|uniref:Uncharacterized protein n=1 Tax=Mycena metata TaxID=1033252 RepID=A0AAD7IM80_9AGAR|nr:hypothetical protein B0H16DRAFT_1726519 [Mycena metata]
MVRIRAPTSAFGEITDQITDDVHTMVIAAVPPPDVGYTPDAAPAPFYLPAASVLWLPEFGNMTGITYDGAVPEHGARRKLRVRPHGGPWRPTGQTWHRMGSEMKAFLAKPSKKIRWKRWAFSHDYIAAFTRLRPAHAQLTQRSHSVEISTLTLGQADGRKNEDGDVEYYLSFVTPSRRLSLGLYDWRGNAQAGWREHFVPWTENIARKHMIIGHGKQPKWVLRCQRSVETADFITVAVLRQNSAFIPFSAMDCSKKPFYLLLV